MPDLRALLLLLPLLLAAEEFPLGALLGMTGAGSAYSRDGADGLALAVDEVNAAGGLLGRHPLRLVLADDRSQPALAASEARRLIGEQRVRAMIGTYSSACALAIRPVAAESQVLHLAPISNTERLTADDADGWSFLMVPSTHMQARAVALGVARLARRNGWTSYATLASDYEFGRSTQAVFVAALQQVAPQLRLRQVLWPQLGEQRFIPFIDRLVAEKPSFVFVSLASDDNAAWVEQAKARDFFRSFPCPGALVSVTELQHQGDALPRGMMGLARAPFFAHLDVPMMQRFMAAFRARFGRLPSDWAVLCYDSVQALRQAAVRAGGIEPGQLRAALLGLELDTCRGRLLMRALDRQLVCPSYLGTVGDDPAWPFPVFKDLMMIPGAECMRSEDEVREMRRH
ncbi:MAG: ABC transporter substrate-binding protein [Planctomycetes bacterium]|nr:ABC transporter substrate-binding protein [Planctomycetota bacterium]